MRHERTSPLESASRFDAASRLVSSHSTVARVHAMMLLGSPSAALQAVTRSIKVLVAGL